MKPLRAFRQNIEAAEELVRLRRLLAGKNVYKIHKGRAAKLRKALHWRKKEQIDRTENQYLYIIIREAAGVPRTYFDTKQLEFLLRQGVVAGCSAMDCYFLEKVQEKIWAVFSKKGATSPRDLLEVRITMQDYLEAQAYKRKGWPLKSAMLNSVRFGSFQSPKSIKEKLKLLGVKDFWPEVARELRMQPGKLEKQLKELVDRRNQIVHKGDRPGNKHQQIDMKWVERRLQLIDRVVNAADRVIDRQVASL